MKQINENLYQAESWLDLQDFLFRETDDRLGRFRSSYAYRGTHNFKYALATSIQRLGSRRPSELEEHIIRNFRKYAPLNTLAGEYNNIWNWIALGQHYGLPTRLLDWTFSPNIALHFMADFEKGFKEDGAIWMVDFAKVREKMPPVLSNIIFHKSNLTFTSNELSELIGNSMAEIREFYKTNGNCLLFMEAPSIDERIINQFALFSLMLDPDTDMLKWLQQHPEVYQQVIIPSELKWEIRDKLDQANITERILYPGLEGISKWLKRWYSPKERAFD